MRFCKPLLILTLVLAGCGLGVEQPAFKKAPDFVLNTPRGASLHLQSEEASGPVFVVFWSVYCEACHELVPLLNRMQDKYGGKGISIIAISVGDPARDVIDYAASHGLKYPLALDSNASVAHLYGIKGTPTAVLIGKDGTIKKAWWQGYYPGMDAEVDAALSASLK